MKMDVNQELIETHDMDNIKQTLENLRTNVAGTLGVALVDYESGMCLGTSGTGLNMDVAAAGNMEVMKAKARVMRDLGIKGGIEDILITLESQYHIIRPVGTALFIYLAIDRKQGNLALARHKLASAAAEVQV
jgi:predicted regulator of Ras-like GTPase activity (Roadblock/LC7/MglB family)